LHVVREHEHLATGHVVDGKTHAPAAGKRVVEHRRGGERVINEGSPLIQLSVVVEAPL
jgi:hypothetical protein